LIYENSIILFRYFSTILNIKFIQHVKPDGIIGKKLYSRYLRCKARSIPKQNINARIHAIRELSESDQLNSIIESCELIIEIANDRNMNYREESNVKIIQAYDLIKHYICTVDTSVLNTDQNIINEYIRNKPIEIVQVVEMLLCPVELLSARLQSKAKLKI